MAYRWRHGSHMGQTFTGKSHHNFKSSYVLESLELVVVVVFSNTVVDDWRFENSLFQD